MKISTDCRMGFIYALFWVCMVSFIIAFFLYGPSWDESTGNYSDTDLTPQIILVNPANFNF